jgi:hypothetical protein
MSTETFRTELELLAIAAKNEAYEEAAAVCEAKKPWGNGADDHAANCLQQAASAIRAKITPI